MRPNAERQRVTIDLARVVPREAAGTGVGDGATARIGEGCFELGLNGRLATAGWAGRHALPYLAVGAVGIATGLRPDARGLEARLGHGKIVATCRRHAHALWIADVRRMLQPEWFGAMVGHPQPGLLGPTVVTSAAGTGAARAGTPTGSGCAASGSTSRSIQHTSCARGATGDGSAATGAASPSRGWAAATSIQGAARDQTTAAASAGVSRAPCRHRSIAMCGRSGRATASAPAVTAFDLRRQSAGTCGGARRIAVTRTTASNQENRNEPRPFQVYAAHVE